MAKYTVKELQDLKGQRKLSFIRVSCAEEVLAAEAAGIDMIGTSYSIDTRSFCKRAPDTHFRMGLQYGEHCNADEAIKRAFEAMSDGADTIYCSMSYDVVERMAKEGIPVIGHVGLVPAWSTWTGGYKAVGKTANQAVELYKQVKRYEEIGAAGVEIEVVPHKVASEISKRTSILTMSLGSGSGCDIQALYGCDILGNPPNGKIPRHAKVYYDISKELKNLQRIRTDAFSEFRSDVLRNQFPETKHLVEIPDLEFGEFINNIERK